VLTKGTTLEMVLDRALIFNEDELNFGGYQPPRTTLGVAQPGEQDRSRSSIPLPRRRSQD
jgi:hypothetical protein